MSENHPLENNIQPVPEATPNPNEEARPSVTEPAPAEAAPAETAATPPAEVPAVEEPAATPPAEVPAVAETGATPPAEVPAVAEPAATDSGSEFEKMMAAWDQQLPSVQKGEFVQGTIVKIKDNDVLVDIGTRCEGVFPAEEIRNAQGEYLYKEGDPITVQVVSSVTTDFTIHLSHKNARRQEMVRQFKKAYEDGTAVTGTISESIKGGLRVNIEGFEGFLPASQIDLRFVENTDTWVGRTEQFRIMKFHPRLGKLVVSRRALLQDEKDRLKSELWNQISVGQVVNGKVTRLTGYGVFVDLGGMEGLIHISNLSWDKVKKPSEIVKVGQEIDVQVIELDKEKDRIGLSLKELVADPWLTVGDRYMLGQRVQGKVEKLESFGAFVKLEPGITGLIPISEMSWARRINHPSEVIKAGDQLETMVLRVDPTERKISLSLKQVTPSPFTQFAADHQPGDILEGEITNVVGYGAFVKLTEQVEGLMHISEIAWSPVRNIDETLHVGDKVSVRILHINHDTEKIALSGRLGEPPIQEGGDAASGRAPRKGGRRAPRRDKEGDEQRYMTDVASFATKLGERFPKELLDRMKAQKGD